MDDEQPVNPQRLSQGSVIHAHEHMLDQMVDTNIYIYTWLRSLRNINAVHLLEFCLFEKVFNKVYFIKIWLCVLMGSL